MTETDIFSGRELLTVKQVARELGESPRAIYRRARRGDLPVVRLGSGPRAPIRIDRADLELWMFACRGVRFRQECETR